MDLMVILEILASASVLAVPSTGSDVEGVRARLVEPGHCLAVSKSTLSRKALAIQGKVVPPRKVQDVQPSYPSREGSTVGKGSWLGEALIDDTGKVREVWVLQELEFDPPWPEFNDAITEAIRQWEYAPATVKGRPVPVCMTISMDIHWK